MSMLSFRQASACLSSPLISIQASSRCPVRRLSIMVSRETHIGVPGASREAITRSTRESVDDDHLASDGCGLSRLVQDFSSLLDLYLLAALRKGWKRWQTRAFGSSSRHLLPNFCHLL